MAWILIVVGCLVAGSIIGWATWRYRVALQAVVQALSPVANPLLVLLILLLTWFMLVPTFYRR